MSNKRYLIINADDFGYNASTNSAVGSLFSHGLITSTSLMSVATGAKEAAELSIKQGFPVGVHFTINSDSQKDPFRSILPSPSLCGSNGGLNHSQKDLALHAKSFEVTTELEAQYLYLLNAGCKVDHADSHCGTLYGINGRLFFINAFSFCKRYSLPFRFPKNPDYLRRQFGGKLPAPLAWAIKGISTLGEKIGVKMLDDMITNPYSKPQTYEELRDYYIDEIKNSRHRITEVFLHPSYPLGNDDIQWSKRENEFCLLRSGDIIQVAEDCGIEVVSWNEAFNLV